MIRAIQQNACLYMKQLFLQNGAKDFQELRTLTSRKMKVTAYADDDAIIFSG